MSGGCQRKSPTSRTEREKWGTRRRLAPLTAEAAVST